MRSTAELAEPLLVTGRVVDAASGTGLAGAVVHAAAERTSVRAGPDGRFALPVPGAALALVAARPGYSFRWQRWDGEPEVTLRLERERPATLPHPDYPRPDADRRGGTGGRWLSLNGTWSLDFDPDDLGLAQQWQREHHWQHAVRVPFSYTSLAGVGEQARAGNRVYASQFADTRGVVWYQREVVVPADWPADRGVLLRFGAVEWHATVFLDGSQVTEHDGGYTPFEIYLGRLTPGSAHSLTVRAVVPDNGIDTPYPQGKQMGWYTDTGGIWQSVWLEPADQARLTTVHITPTVVFDGTAARSAQALVDLHGTTGTVHLTVRQQAGNPAAAGKPAHPRPGRVVATATVQLTDDGGSARLDIPTPQLWHPDHPWLYHLEATLDTPDHGRDAVGTWFGLRRISRDWAPGHSPAEQSEPTEQYQYLYLNNRPLYLRSALDQAFTPWGGYSYTGSYQDADLHSGQLADPGKGSVLFDLVLAKQLGLNSTRVHLKPNDPRYYYWADTLGLLVWYDQPNFGYHGYGPAAERLWESTLRAAVHRDFNHPSIVIWADFNEAWGFGRQGGPIRPDAIGWIERMVALTRSLLGATRLVVDNSPCCENRHLVTDLNDFHGYHSTYAQWQPVIADLVATSYPGSPANFTAARTQSGQPLLNSEFGPWSGGAERDQEVATPFRYTAELFRRQPKLNGYVFTELTDLEWEWNGWAGYDRTLQAPGYLDADGGPGGVGLANADDVLLVDAPPVQRTAPGATFSLPVLASLFSGRPLDDARLRWRVSGTDSTGAALPATPWEERPVTAEPFTTCALGSVEVTVPASLTAGRLDLQLRCANEIIATGQTGLADWSPTAAPPTVVRLNPATAEPDWPQGSAVFSVDGATAAWGCGDGEFRWTVPVPEPIRSAPWTDVHLVVEAAAARPGLPRTRFPQTSERRYPTTLTATVNGLSRTVLLPDAPADARGMLSHESGFDPGRYGYRVVLPLDAAHLREHLGDQLTLTLRGSGGGLTVFGPRTGRFGISPQLVFSTAPLPAPEVAAAEPGPTTREGAGVNTHLVPGQPRAGQPTTMIIAIVNDSPRTVTAVRPALLLPAGWRAEPSDAPGLPGLEPGQAHWWRYRVTPAAAGKARLSSRAYYTERDNKQVTQEHWDINVAAEKTVTD